MDSIAYEEFPKLTSEHDNTSLDNRDRENDGDAEDDRRDSQALHHHHPHPHHPSAPYTTATEPVYPNEPPPAYTVTSAFELPGFSAPQFQPYTSASAAADARSHPDALHFGVLIDRPALPPPIVVSQAPSDFLPLSIFNLVFCCLLFGVFAVLKSVATRAAVDVGDYSLAYVHSLEARNWNIAASVTGGIIWTLFIVFIVVFSLI